MVISETLDRVFFPFKLLKNLVAKTGILIPYGRYSYGPQPELLGFMPVLAKKAAGSRIGNFCSISSGVKFSFLDTHNYKWVSTYPFYDFYNYWHFDTESWHKCQLDTRKIKPRPIIIENDVWLCSNILIKEGVKVGSGAVVAMGSLVTKDVPPYAFVGGNPARIIRYRFSPKQISDLLEIAWWDWPDEEIKEIIPLLLSEDPDPLISFGKNRCER